MIRYITSTCTCLHYYIKIKHSAYLINGFLVSDCLLPCLRTEATVKEGTASGGEELPTFYLLFNPEVRVTFTTVDKFKFLEALNFFGSNLGLWPGRSPDWRELDWVGTSSGQARTGSEKRTGGAELSTFLRISPSL